MEATTIIDTIIQPSLLGCKISADLDVLAVLGKKYSWIPDENGIRPSPENIQRKRERLAIIESQWHGFLDYILNLVFEKPFIKRLTPNGEVKNKVVDRDVTNAIKFVPNEFPYQSRSGNHWVLWFGSPTQPISDDEITVRIQVELLKVCGESTPFDFAWYINPKMTAPEYFHVQVFWTTLDHS